MYGPVCCRLTLSGSVRYQIFLNSLRSPSGRLTEKKSDLKELMGVSIRIGHVLSTWWARLSEGSDGRTRDSYGRRKLSKAT